jgi:hypothetical protein
MSVVDGTFTCVEGDMPLSKKLHDSLSEVFVDRSRDARRQPLNWGGQWFCPGCGCQATTAVDHVRCGTCGQYLDEFLYQLIEVHPHGGHGGRGRL